MPTLIVTGASRGSVAATALLAASRGYSVAVNYVANAEAAYRVVGSIRNNGGRAMAIQADVSREAEVLRLFDRAAAELGPITGVVNNAATLDKQTRLENFTAERIQRVFALNVTGVFLCCREAVRRMSTARGHHGGAIVNVSSIAARLGSPGEYIDYAASKAAIDTLTIGLAREVAEEGIRVNAVRPGVVLTDIHALGGEPSRPARVAPQIPMKRAGQPQEIATAILYLLSEEASYITGSILDVSGGR